MKRTMRLATFFALVVAVVGAFPGHADATPRDHGSTVICKYRTDSPTGQAWTALLKRIVVSPPEMFANSGR
jgi:hypothetical protein